MKTQKIALVLAGGVSLGSYEAGVMTELLYALDCLNRQADDQTRPRYVLDVMTGGSAGGMTAILTARIMMYDYVGRKHHLYEAWVEAIDIEKLLTNDGKPLNALFSKQAIADIVNAYVVRGADGASLQPASFAPDLLRVSVSLSNMHGIDYDIPYFPVHAQGTRSAAPAAAQSFVTTFFADVARFTFHKTTLPSEEEWRRIGAAAIATGNFPIAFSPQPLSRQDRRYPSPPNTPETHEYYIDGGVFNNEPLGEAITLAKQADGGCVDPDRLFILIDPNINNSLRIERIDPDGHLLDHTGRLLTMIFGQSTAQDWLRAHRKNAEIEWRDQFVRTLGDLLLSPNVVPADQCAAAFGEIAEGIVARKRALFGVGAYPDDYVTTAIAQTFQRPPFCEVEQQFDACEHGEIKKAVFRNVIFILNNVAGLQKKSALRLALIGAEGGELAGDVLRAFGGFFERDWRIYDYRVGRNKAHALLTEIFGQSYPKESDARGAEHQDYHLPDEWQRTFPQATVTDISPELRRQLRDRVLERADCVMRALRIPWLFRWLLRVFVMRKALRQHLHV
jgi:predicted acylesterase/phospholipase RssA